MGSKSVPGVRTSTSGRAPSGGWQRVLCGASALAACFSCVLDLGPPIPETIATAPSPVDTASDSTTTSEPGSSEGDSSETTAVTTAESDSSSDPKDAEAPPVPPEGGPTETPTDPSESSLPAEPEAGPACGPGFIECEMGCVLGNSCTPPPTCEELCQRDHATTQCVNDVCTLIECDAGWVDCDGQLGTGCEVDFGQAPPSDPLSIPQLNISEDDDWAGVPVYPLAQACAGCGQDFSNEAPQAGVFKDVAPAPKGDLMAGVSFAWSPGGLWLRAIIFDQQLVTGQMGTAPNKVDARYNDNLHFVFDGDEYGNSVDAEDHHLYIALDGTLFDERKPDQAALRNVVAIQEQELGTCRLLQAQLSTEYLSGGDNFDFSVGKTFGVALAINDFDDSDDSPPEPERQHQEFLLSPGEDYVYGPRQLPRLRLVDALGPGLSDAGAP